VDIWAWVSQTERALREAGHDRLADLLDEIPTAVCDDEHARVDALVPEAVALARALKLPWVELFLRHWHLQSRVLHRLEVKSAQRESVALLEAAHRDEMRECPQAVCAVQDFAACHGLVDGPGYAEERMQVCRETLARIGPRWPCFTCISGELADALVDAGDPAASLALVHAQRAAMASAGVRLDDQLLSNEVVALLELGRAAEALAALERAARAGRRPLDDHSRAARRLLRAHALVLLDHAEEAAAALPPREVVHATASHWLRWATVTEALVRAGAAPNDAALGHEVSTLRARLAEQGVCRGAFELALIEGRLALARDDHAGARAALAAAEALVPLLRVPGTAPGKLAGLAGALPPGPRG
jgi:hypothetical protein